MATAGHTCSDVDHPPLWGGLEMLEGRILLSSTTDLVAHWTFDEAIGPAAADWSPYGIDNSGTLVGDATWDPAGGIFGGALRLDGNGDYVNVANSADINIGTFPAKTVALRFKADDTSISSHKQVIYEQGDGTRGLNIYLYDSRLYVGGWNRSESNWDGDWISTAAIESDTWYHVTLVLDGTDTVQPDAMTVYLDSVVIGTSQGSQLWSHSGDIRLGSSGNSRYHDGASGDGGFAGMLDDARLYNRALAAAEVDELANTAPVASDGAVVTDEDTPIDAQLDVTDQEADALTYTIVTGPAHGTITAFDSNTGEFTYESDADYNGEDGFTFTASDGVYTSDTATVAITVSAVNDAPVATDDAFTTNEDDCHIGALTATDADAGAGATLFYAIVSGPAHGSITFFDRVTGMFMYQPDANYGGTDSLTFVATDGFADSTVATVSITVDAVNDAPVADDGVVSLISNTSVTAMVTGTDVDAGSTLTFRIVDGPSHGTIASLDAATGEYTYVPDADYHGPDSFSFAVSDGAAESMATVAVTVITSAPIVNDGVLILAEDTSASGSIVVTDAGIGGALVFTVVDGPAHGQLVDFDPATGEFTYAGNANYHGIDSFTFRVSNGQADSRLATIAITVTSVNDAPVTTVPPAQTTGGTTWFSPLTDNAIIVHDIDSATVRITLIIFGGIATLGDTTGLTFSQGDGIADRHMVFTGTIDAVNAALTELAVRTADGARITIITEDLDDDGQSTGQRDVDTVLIYTIESAPSDEPTTETDPEADPTPPAADVAFEAAEITTPTVAEIDTSPHLRGAFGATRAVPPAIDALDLAAEAQAAKAAETAAEMAVTDRLAFAGEQADDGVALDQAGQRAMFRAQGAVAPAATASNALMRAFVQWPVVGLLAALEGVLNRRRIATWWQRRLKRDRSRSAAQ